MEIQDVQVVERETLPAGIFPTDPVEAFKKAEELVGLIAKKCKGPQFIANIKGKEYPKVEWWTNVGAVLGLFPYTIFSHRVDDDGHYKYEARVEVRRNGLAITSAEAICSTEEKRWKNTDEYAVKSMAITRATAKAYRIGLSFLATLAGLEATPAEEVPEEGFNQDHSEPIKKTAPKKRFDDETIKLAERMHAYMLAQANGDEDGAKKILRLRNEHLNLPAVDMFGKMTQDDIHKIWEEIQFEVIGFEEAGGASGK